MKLGFDFDKEPFEIAGDEFVSYYGENFHKTKLQNGSRFVLRAIQSNSISQSILSAGRQDFLLIGFLSQIREIFFKNSWN